MTQATPWFSEVPNEATRAVVGYLLNQMRLAGVKQSFELQATFALYLTLSGVQRIVDLNTALQPDAMITVEPSHNPAGEINNLCVKIVAAQGIIKNGVKVSLANVLFEDWENAAAGIRPQWKEILELAATPRVDAYALGIAIDQALDANDIPLAFRARQNLNMVACTTPEERAIAQAKLLADFPSIGVRGQHYDADNAPTQAEVHRRFQGMPFRRSGDEKGFTS